MLFKSQTAGLVQRCYYLLFFVFTDFFCLLSFKLCFCCCYCNYIVMLVHALYNDYYYYN